MMNTDTRARLAGVVAALLCAGAVTLLLLFSWLWPPRLSPAQAAIAEADSSEILLGSEYVIAGDLDVLSDDNSFNNPATTVTEPSPSDTPEGNDRVDAGPAADPAPLVQTAKPSPAKATQRPVPEAPGSPRANTASEAKPSAKASQEASSKVKDRTNFSSTPSASDASGNTGSPEGNDTHGASAGRPGFYLAGRTLAKWILPSGPSTGTIVINVKVDRQGRVVAATYGKGTGPVASSQAARQSCIAAARGSSFSVSENAPAEQQGTITYRFK